MICRYNIREVERFVVFVEDKERSLSNVIGCTLECNTEVGSLFLVKLCGNTKFNAITNFK